MLKIARRVFDQIPVAENYVRGLYAIRLDYTSVVSGFHVDILGNLRTKILFLIHRFIFKKLFDIHSFYSDTFFLLILLDLIVLLYSLNAQHQ